MPGSQRAYGSSHTYHNTGSKFLIEWCQQHPTFAGLAQSAWCARLKVKDDDQPHETGRSQQVTVYTIFCLECTP